MTYDAAKCAINTEKIENLERDVKKIDEKLNGNGKKGIAEITISNSIWLKVVFLMNFATLSGIVKLIFFGR